MTQTKYMVVEVTDMRTKAKSYKLYERARIAAREAVVVGLATREEAEAKAREMEAGNQA